MDASTQIALIEKVRRIFATDDRVFLSFPFLSPVRFTIEALQGAIAPRTTADYQAASEFARAVNFVPHGTSAMADTGEFLWDVFEDVLARGRPGTAAPDPAADARRAAARALLYTEGEGGIRLESAAYLQYRRYRDAVFVAQQDYTARCGSAETLTGAARVAWDETEAPRLRAAIDAAKADLDTLGRRADIEAALASERSAAASDPAARWAEWIEAFDPTIDLMTDTSGQRYALSGFSPTDLGTDASWLHAELDRAELDLLVAGAPPELPRSGGSSDVAHVAFEYRAVTINRPWFDVAALTSGIWRGAPGDPPLSDGGQPPAGRLPAYVSAMVLVRRITVRSAGRTSPVAVPDFRFTLAAAATRIPKLQRFDPELLRRLRPVAPTPPQPSPRSRLVRQLAAQTFTAAPGAGRPPPEARGAGFTRDGVLALRRRGGLDLAAGRGVVPPLLRFPQAMQGEAPPPDPGVTTPVATDDSVAVLAFICKRLPRTPDPLPGLTWS